MTLPALKFGERADCSPCEGSGRQFRASPDDYEDGRDVICPDCRGTGKELTREDHLTLSAEPSESDLESVKDEAEEIEAYWTAREKRNS